MSIGSGYGAVCDDFYVSSRLFLKLEMSLEPEAVLHFFDRIRKEYPTLRKLRRREASSFTLEDEADEHGSRRWMRLDASSLRFGHFAPPDLDAVRRFGGFLAASVDPAAARSAALCSSTSRDDRTSTAPSTRSSALLTARPEPAWARSWSCL